MTQVASPQVVRAPFDGRTLREPGRAVRVWREGDALLAQRVAAPDSDLAPWPAPRRVVMTTGSHHLQAYWTRGEDGLLEQLPFVYLIREARWLSNEDSFLHPPDGPEEHDAPYDRFVWSDNCVSCHSTGPQAPPRQSPESAPLGEAPVSELGIACEACHGPGQAHVAANRNPARRYLLHLTGRPDPTIFNPGRADPARASDVCGRCHMIASAPQRAPLGAFRPGDELADFIDLDALKPLLEGALAVVNPDDLSDQQDELLGSFWPDHTVRVAGREYLGMRASACATDQRLSCMSCHSMHQGDPDRQLRPQIAPQAPCVSCHASIGADVPAHTRHAADSAGSDCLNCHMPYTSYGLLMATRSHQIDSPTVARVGTSDRPNACNLCHLDRSLGWTARALAARSGAAPQALPPERAEIAAGALWLLAGDAAQRALAAWHVGWAPAREASAVHALAPMLDTTRRDPYAAVRQLSDASWRALELPARLEAAPDDPRLIAPPALRAGLLQDASGRARPDAIRALASQRDDRPTWIAE